MSITSQFSLIYFYRLLHLASFQKVMHLVGSSFVRCVKVVSSRRGFVIYMHLYLHINQTTEGVPAEPILIDMQNYMHNLPSSASNVIRRGYALSWQLVCAMW